MLIVSFISILIVSYCMQILSLGAAVIGVICIIAGATMVPDTDMGIVETIKALPDMPAKAMVVFALGVVFLFLALYLRSREDP